MSPIAFFGVASFFIEGFFISPFAFFLLPLVSSEVFSNEPLCISWGCLFFHQRSFLMCPLAFLLSLFHRMSFFMRPLHFFVGSFFIEGLFL
jgi:hypothetical protein